MLSDQDSERRGAMSEDAGADDAGFKVFDRRFWAESEESAATEPERPAAPTYVSQLEQQVEEKDRKLREYIAAYKKEVVENLEQTKLRLQRDAEQQMKALRGELAVPLIELMETLERSVQQGKAGADTKTLIEGLEMLHLLMAQKLRDLGLERINALGEAFDPRVHEAVSVVPVADPSLHNRVTLEIAPGFLCDGRVLRAAKVQVGKAEAA